MYSSCIAVNLPLKTKLRNQEKHISANQSKPFFARTGKAQQGVIYCYANKH